MLRDSFEPHFVTPFSFDGATLMDEVRQRLRDFVIENLLFGIEHETLTDDTNLRELVLLDSLAIVSLVAHIEETFDVTLHGEDLEALDPLSVAKIESLMRSRQSSATST